MKILVSTIYIINALKIQKINAFINIISKLFFLKLSISNKEDKKTK